MDSHFADIKLHCLGGTVPLKGKLPPLVSFLARLVSFLARRFSFLARRISFLLRITDAFSMAYITRKKPDMCKSRFHDQSVVSHVYKFELHVSRGFMIKAWCFMFTSLNKMLVEVSLSKFTSLNKMLVKVS